MFILKLFQFQTSVVAEHTFYLQTITDKFFAKKPWHLIWQHLSGFFGTNLTTKWYQCTYSVSFSHYQNKIIPEGEQKFQILHHKAKDNTILKVTLHLRGTSHVLKECLIHA